MGIDCVSLSPILKCGLEEIYLINNDVQLFFANNEDGNIEIIYDLKEEDRNRKYSCPVCGSEVKPVCVDYKTKDGETAKISPHFSHFDSTKCNSESRIHYWTKNEFLKAGDKFSVYTYELKEYICKEVQIEQVYKVGDKQYNPDITIITESGDIVFFELSYTNKKNIKDYIDIWNQLKNIVIEVDIKTLINANKTHNYVFNALYYEGKCFDKAKNNIYDSIIGRYKRDISEKGLIDNYKDRLQKLDWFWKEVINYKKGISNLEYLTELIDYNESEEKDIIFKILSKKSCVPIYEDYINYKIKQLYNICLNFLEGYKKGVYSSKVNVNKIKVGRKYKNIIYNVIQIEGIINKRFSLIIDSKNKTKEEAIELISTNLNRCKQLNLYYRKFKQINKDIKEMFIDLPYNLSISITKNTDINSDVLGIIGLINYDSSYYLNHVSNIMIYENKIGDLDLNIIDKNDYIKIMEYIYNKISGRISSYEQKQKIKEIDISFREINTEKINEEKLLSLKTERDEFSYYLWKIVKVFDKNKEQIIEYSLNFEYQKYDNLLYFKNYKGEEYIICSRKSNLHLKDVGISDLYSYYFQLGLPQNYKKIIIDNFEGDVDYITYNGDVYSFCSEDDIYNNIFCRFTWDTITDKKLYFTFKNLPYSINKTRFNFINATKQLQNIIEESKNYINLKKDELVSQYILNNNSAILNRYLNITSKEINDAIKKVLYPIISEVQKDRSEFTFVFNADFSLDEGKRQPWLIKDFVEALRSVGIKNTYNIK